MFPHAKLNLESNDIGLRLNLSPVIFFFFCLFPVNTAAYVKEVVSVRASTKSFIIAVGMQILFEGESST